jgi:hypothetical protein
MDMRMIKDVVAKYATLAAASGLGNWEAIAALSDAVDVLTPGIA